MIEPIPESSEQTYDLFLREGTGGIVFRLKDHGITAGAAQLGYSIDGYRVSRPYDSISTVTLSTAAAGRAGVMGQCVIVFRGGVRLVIWSANAAGLPDRSREGPFRDFVVDFHRRLITNDADRRITFIRGISGTRHTILMVALVVWAVLFVAFPLLLALFTGTPNAALVALAGLALVVPFWRVADRNRPGGYNPAHPPDLLA